MKISDFGMSRLVPADEEGSPRCTIFPLHVGSEASSFTQVSLQPSYTVLWLQPHPLVNWFSVVMAPHNDFMWILKLLASNKCHYSHLTQSCDSNHTHLLTGFQ